MGVGLLHLYLALALGEAQGRQDDVPTSRMPPWVESNFVGKPPPYLIKSKKGALELVSLLGSKRFRHAPGIWGLAFNEDGTRILSVTYKTYKVWDVASGDRWPPRGTISGLRPSLPLPTSSAS